MKYLSDCSGIEAATVAWHPLGWEAFAYSEIEKFPSALLAHHYPDTPNFGDMTKFKEWPDAAIDVLVGGTPCQSFSIAGLRKGLDDPRGNLMLTYLAIADKYRPKWLVWENVPGVLSSNSGKDFGALLGGLGELGYGFAYRVLDAQYFGVPQRRRRVFVVGGLGDWRSAAAVLFERHSMSGHPAPRRKAKEKLAGAITAGAFSGGAGGRVDGAVAEHFQAVTPPLTTKPYGDNPSREGLLIASTGEISHCLNAGGMGRQDYETETMVIALAGTTIDRAPENGGNGLGADTSGLMYTLTATDRHAVALDQLKGSGPNFDPVAFHHQASSSQSMNPDVICPTLDKSKSPAVAAFKGGQGSKAGGIGYSESTSPTLGAADSGSNLTPTLMLGMQVRRLTPVECERLQGFEDEYTKIPNWKGWRKMDSSETPESCIAEGLEIKQSKKSGKWRVRDVDGPRYKAVGNSMARPVMEWIGERIAAVESIDK